ncbi:hypothetical protein D3C73_1317550 [compost metagenome]
MHKRLHTDCKRLPVFGAYIDTAGGIFAYKDNCQAGCNTGFRFNFCDFIREFFNEISCEAFPVDTVGQEWFIHEALPQHQKQAWLLFFDASNFGWGMSSYPWQSFLNQH